VRCKGDIEWLQLTTVEQVLQFGHNSLSADRWANSCDRRPYEGRVKEHVARLEQLGEEAGKCKAYCQAKLKPELLPSLGYPLREFLAVCLKKTALQAIYNPIRNVVLDGLACLPEAQFHPTQLHLALFLLCFLDEVNASCVFKHLLRQMQALSDMLRDKDFEAALRLVVGGQLKGPEEREVATAATLALLAEGVHSALVNYVSPSIIVYVLGNWIVKGSIDELIKMAVCMGCILKEDYKSQYLQQVCIQKIDKKTLKGKI
jgi:hypothetical protein